MAYTDAELKSAVDSVFSQFDKDNSGSLDKSEVLALINAALSSMGAGRQATSQEVDGLISSVDTSHDGKISKDELLVIFRKVTG